MSSKNNQIQARTIGQSHELKEQPNSSKDNRAKLRENERQTWSECVGVQCLPIATSRDFQVPMFGDLDSQRDKAGFEGSLRGSEPPLLLHSQS